jgi:hypothetical protein
VRAAGSLCDLPCPRRQVLEHGSALMASREEWAAQGFRLPNFNTPCAAGPHRREGSQPLERRNLTLSRAVSILSGDGLSTEQ